MWFRLVEPSVAPGQASQQVDEFCDSQYPCRQNGPAFLFEISSMNAIG